MKVTGWLADDQPPISLTAIFADTGEYGIEKMAEITKETEHTGRLTDSLMWSTSSTQHNINNKADEISKPTNKETLHIGSGAPHAVYRELYSGIHHSAEGSPEFIELLKQWAEDVLGIDVENQPFRWEALLLQVRNTETEGNPFIEPNVRSIANYMASRFPHTFNIYAQNVVNKQKEIK
jgi:hypothetical protein